ncbi:MAG: hypothetical protein BHW09_06325 [Clostridium sp. CAG:245_30_32]|nr:MAG: hypothetical protein BHW09_06325 [Clostridium sp. CAG:245_30_32]
MNEIFCLKYNKVLLAIIIIAIAINVSKNMKRLGADLVFFFANYQNILQKCYNTIKLKLQ